METKSRRVAGGSLGALRELNRLRVVDALRRSGTASRSELARQTGLSRTTVASLVADLRGRGFVVEGADEVAAIGRGRPPAMLRLDASAGAALGVDFGHRHVRVAVADLSSRVLAERFSELDVDRGATAALDAAAELAAEVMAEAGIGPGRIVGAGMGVPGPFDRSTGRISSPAMLPSWQALRPADELAQRLGVPVEVDNDANLGALGELWFGAGRRFADLVYVKVASGIGAGLVLDGRLHRGSTGTAGEIGHIAVASDGPLCTCGSRGCLEAVAAAGPVLTALRAAHGPALTLRAMLELVEAGDVAAAEVVGDAGRAIGRVLADLCSHVNPSAIVIGGTLSRAGRPLLAGVREALDRYALPGAARAVELEAGVLGARAEVLGALALVIDDTERLRSVGLAALHDAIGRARR